MCIRYYQGKICIFPIITDISQVLSELIGPDVIASVKTDISPVFYHEKIVSFELVFDKKKFYMDDVGVCYKREGRHLDEADVSAGCHVYFSFIQKHVSRSNPSTGIPHSPIYRDGFDYSSF